MRKSELPGKSYVADVVVVGSGAGGGVMALELAASGLDVILVEEGPYKKTESFQSGSIEAFTSLYRKAGTAMIMGNPGIPYAEGRCVGGSTVLNGGVSWRTPEKILHRWEMEHGIAHMGPEAMVSYFEKVEVAAKVGRQHPESVGKHSETFKRGADRLGWETKEVMRNQVRCVGTNNCGFGCPTGAKQSVLLSYIPRFLNHGGLLLSDLRIRKILMKRNRAIGVSGERVEDGVVRSITIYANLVVISAGASETPHLLMKSKAPNESGKLGKNLLVHPNIKAVGVFPDVIDGWKGVIQTHQVHEFVEEGIMLATTMVPPALLALSFPFWGAQIKTVMSEYNRMLCAGALVEDTGSGRVFAGPFDEPILYYNLNSYDTQKMVRALALLCELQFSAGASKVYTPIHGMEVLSDRDDIKKLYQHKLKPSDLEIFTVHIMGTCQMGGDSKRSVTDSFGRVHGTTNLYVADASLFPTPIGVNPQLTIKALATRSAMHIISERSQLLRRII